MEKMMYLLYKITNLINQKYYIGAHKTNDRNDNYLGSGKAIKRAIIKYGRENFIKEVIKECKTEQDMYDNEIRLVGTKWKIDPLCYNTMPGGVGGFDHINSTNINRGQNNVMKRPEVVAKVIAGMKYTRSLNPEYYNNIARKNLLKAVEKNTGK